MLTDVVSRFFDPVCFETSVNANAQHRPQHKQRGGRCGMFHDPVSLSEASSVLKSLSIMRRFLVPVLGDGVVQQREARLAAVAADHELPWPPKHFTPKRGRPNSDAAWVRAVQRRLLAGGDLPSGVTGKRPR